MPAGEAKEKNMIKSRMVVLAQMFYEHTDQEHPMTGLEILEYLKEHDVPANEKTLRGDIKLLQELGLDIVKVVSRPNLFYWGERQFEMPELKLLVDAVSSSRFITKKKSNALGKKLAQLASENQRKELRRNIQATTAMAVTMKNDWKILFFIHPSPTGSQCPGWCRCVPRTCQASSAGCGCAHPRCGSHRCIPGPRSGPAAAPG